MQDPNSIPAPSSTRRKGFSYAPIAALLLILAGCSGAPASSATTTPTPAPTTLTPAPTTTVVAPTATPAAPTLAPSPSAKSAFPLTLTDDEGTAVEIPAMPKRIISLSPATTEILFALGAGDRVVGGTDQDDYPAEAAALPDVATYTGVILDKVASLEPDLVLAGGNGFTAPASIDRMRDLHIPVLVLYAQTVDNVYADIELIGAAAGTSADASSIVATMRSRMDQASQAAAATTGRPKVFYEIGYGPDIYGPADGFFVTQMIDLAGGKAITTGSPTAFAIPLERLVSADPDVIVVGDALYGVCPADVAARAGWGSLAAVKNGAVRPVNDIVVTRPGPRLPDGLASLARAIHPEIVLTGFPADPPLCTGPGPSPGASSAP
jgi:iron complex transport system substrate-binding protein